ncbi:MAG TPA: hypothetical protein VMW27_15785 [Thermoanaerobaculia bacterium]|nr:hypothetical protein [Thermoanaerobaculia bacterium]
MFSKKARRTIPLLLAVALLALPGLAQAGSFDRMERGSASLFDLFQQRIADLASTLWGGVTGAWDKGGASIDPSGTPGTGTGTTGGSSTEGGNSIDPSGTPGGSGSGQGTGSGG